MKKIFLIMGVICLLALPFNAMADETVEQQPAAAQEQTAPQIPDGQMQPPQKGEQGEMPQRPEGMGQGNMGERPNRQNMTQPENVTQQPSAEQPTDIQAETPQVPENENTETNTENSQPNNGEFNPMDMENFPFGESAETTPANPLAKWITPIISALSLIFGFVFVVFYKRKHF